MDPDKLLSYKASLVEVEAALEANPDNEELLKLRDDLKELLQLYDTELKETEEEVKEVGPNDDMSASNASAELSAVVGRTCIISSTFQYATIEKIVEVDKDSGRPTKLGVCMLGDDDVTNIDVGDVRLLGPYDASSLEPGTAVQGLYSDGVWYNCTVRKKPQRGFVLVKYDEYDEEEELPLDRIRSRTWNQEKKKGTVTVKKEQAAKKFITTPGGYTIPASLIVRPGDSAAVREQKRKKLEQTKKDQKRLKIEDDFRQRQSSWQAHVSNAQSRFKTQMVFTRRKH